MNKLIILKKRYERYVYAVLFRIKCFYAINDLNIEVSGLTNDGIPYVKIKDDYKFHGYLSTPIFNFLYIILIRKRQKQKLKRECARVAFDIVFRYYKLPEREYYSDYKKGDTVLEIGAFIGYFVMYASKKVSTSGLVIGIEAIKENFRILELNINENHLNNVRIAQIATWDEQGTIKFQRHHRQRASAKKNVVRLKEEISVPCNTVDNILSGLGVSRVDFIRIQVNGAEIETLSGMRALLKLHPMLSVANMYIDTNTESESLVSFLENKTGYTLIHRNGSVFASLSSIMDGVHFSQ